MRAALCMAVALVGAAHLTAQTPRDVVARAVGAMGGEPALRGLTSVSVDFYTATFGIGQEETPQSQARASFAIGQTLTDYAGGRQTGTVELRNPGGVVNRLRRVVAGGIGMLETNGRPAPESPGTVTTIESAMRRALERLLLAALDAPTALRTLPARNWRGELHDGVRYANGPDTVDLYFDRRTALPVVTETVSDDPILGDRHTVSWFTRWQASGALLYPRQYDVEVNGRLQTHSVFTAVTINAGLADSLFAIPDRKSTRLNSSHVQPSRMPSSA